MLAFGGMLREGQFLTVQSLGISPLLMDPPWLGETRTGPQ